MKTEDEEILVLLGAAWCRVDEASRTGSAPVTAQTHILNKNQPNLDADPDLIVTKV